MKKLSLALILTAFVLVGTAPAQVTTGVGGTVTDESGAGLPGVAVGVRNADTGLARNTVSDEVGAYQVGGLPPGSYLLTAERDGFARYIGRVTTTVGQSVKFNLALKVKGVAEEISVVDSTPLLDRSKTETSNVVETRRIEGLPISGRNFLDLILVSTPAASLGRDTRGGGALLEPDSATGTAAAPRIAFGGQREYYALVQVDGVDNTQSVTGLTRAVPSEESVREFRVLNSNYSSEFGRALSGVINIITKSGTNDYHGSAYYFWMGDALKARSSLKARDADRLAQHQFGGSFGGPVVRNKTFLFGSYEGQQHEVSNQFSQLILNNLDAINRVKTAFGLTPERADLLRSNSYDQYFVKLDSHLTERTNLSLRYNLLDSGTRNFLGAAGRTASASSTARDSFLTDQSLAAHATSAFSATWVGEGQFQYARRSFRFPSRLNEPTFELPNLLTMGKSPSDIDAYRETRWQTAGSLSRLGGARQTKAGFDLNHLSDDVRWEIFFPARIIFPGLAGFLGLPPFNGPTPVAFQWSAPAAEHPGLDPDFTRSIPEEWDDSVDYGYGHSYHGFFVHEQWNARPRLALNYGLRYDFDRFPEGTFRGDYNNLQPRAGLAYSLSDKLVLRAGFGIYTGRRTTWSTLVPGAIYGLKAGDARAHALGDFFTLDAQIYNFILSGPPLAGPAMRELLATGRFPSTARARRTAVPIEADNRNPYSEQASLSLAYELGPNLTVTADYLYVHGLKLQGSRNVNAVRSGTSADGRPLFAGAHDPSFLFIQSAPNWGNSVYHGGTLSVAKRFSRRFGLNAGYNFSRTVDDVGSSHDIGAMPLYVERGLERAVSNQHVAHRFVSDFVAETPPRGPFRDFKFSAIFVAESPRYFTVYVGSDANLDGNPLNDRPGQLGRNTFRGDTYVSLDARLTRTFRLGERAGLALMVEGFNLLNTLNIKDFNTVYGSASLSAPPAAILGFGQPREVFEPRRIQLAAKLRF